VPKEQKPSAAGRWYLAGIGLSLALMGGFFVWAMWRSFERAREMSSWPEVPCVILSSEIKERRIDPNSPPEYRVEIEYGYEFAGKARTGDHSTLRGNPWTSKMDVVEKKQTDYPAGGKTICHVNPANPDFSVLKVDSKAPGYSIWFPSLFVVGGLGIMVRALTVKK
jgi:hypothetical protein